VRKNSHNVQKGGGGDEEREKRRRHKKKIPERWFTKKRFFPVKGQRERGGGRKRGTLSRIEEIKFRSIQEDPSVGPKNYGQKRTEKHSAKRKRGSSSSWSWMITDF